MPLRMWDPTSSHGPLRYSHAPRCKLTGSHFWKLVDLNVQGRQLFTSRLNLWTRVFGGFLQSCPWIVKAIPSLKYSEVQIVKEPTLAAKISASGVPFTVVESSEASAPQRIEDGHGMLVDEDTKLRWRKEHADRVCFCQKCVCKQHGTWHPHMF